MEWWRQTKEDIKRLAPVVLSFFILAVCAVIGCAAGQPENGLPVGLFAGLILGSAVAPILAKWKVPSEEEASKKRTPQVLGLYLEGKMKRYTLMFSVNGGAFAIAKLLREPHPPGGLSMDVLAWGAVVFTLLMTSDIWLWGAGIREEYGEKLFRPVGQTVLLMIGSLLVSGWVLIAVGD